MSGRSIFVIQKKGSTGKTFLTSHLFEYLRTKGATPELYDADLSTGPLLRIFPGIVRAIDLRDEEVFGPNFDPMTCPLFPLLDGAIKGETYIVDFGANSQRSIIEYFYSRITFEDALKEPGASKLTVLCPVTHHPDTHHGWDRIKHAFGWATLIQVRVTEPGAPKPQFPAHPAELCLDMPRAIPSLVERYLRENRTICDFARETSGHPILRLSAQAYVRDLFSRFDRISQHLLP